MAQNLYFAYGSNLNRTQMNIRCPGALPVAGATLRGWRIEYRRVLTIVRQKGATVDGALWLTDAVHEETLDRYEGYPRLYIKKWVVVQAKIHQVTYKARAYVYMMQSGRVAEPSGQYLHTCLEGAMDWGIPFERLIPDNYRVRVEGACQ